MKKKIGLIVLASLSFCAIGGTCIGVSYAHNNQQVIEVCAEGEGTTEIEQPVETETTETTETTEPTTVVDEVKEWVDKFFSPQMVAMYMSWLAYIGTIIGLVANIKKLKQTNNLTLKNVSDEVQNKLEIVVSKQVAEQFGKITPKLIDGQEKANQIMSIFAKILALSQENTPESKVAILNLIEELGVVGKDLTNTAKEVVIETKELAEQTKKEIDKKIDEIVDSYDGTSI